ncbi:enolase 4-like isoform X1 [Mizuhopecten yessoensis]|uniref:enolase 4-like isoform X1 n=1 Tax=Mizuhopecten yessoensis TaxID=6573 RepID=UPI000B45EF0C|nr:enolase 4-like isoform X1 [Mizuhopecten yessoensis]
MAFSPTTIATQTTSARDPRELYEIKQKAVKYYNDNGVPNKMEDVLNTMFYDSPSDVFGYLANYFEKFATTPTITKIKAREAYDSKGQPTVQTEVFCTVKNNLRLSATVVSPTPNSHLPDNTKPEDREADDTERQNSVTAAVSILNTDLNNRLTGLDPAQQQEVDNVVSNFYAELQAAEEERLAKEADAAATEEGSTKDVETASQASGKGKQPKSASNDERGKDQKKEERVKHSGNKSKDDRGKHSANKPVKGGKSQMSVAVPVEPSEKFLPGAGAVSTISRAACMAAAHIQQIPVFQHVAGLRFTEVPFEMTVPTPMVTIIQSGRAALGKSNCIKEFIVVPKPGMPLSQSLPLIQKIYNYVGKNLFTKSGVAAKLTNDIGAFCPTFDRPEQGLDLLQEAIAQCDLTVGEDFFLAINCASHEIFDYDLDQSVKEKGKYEILTGQAKVADDVVEFWAELLGRYPSVIAVIDPLRRQEKEHWMRLSDRISDQCFVVGGHAYARPGLLKDEELTPDFVTSGIALKLDRLNTITDTVQVAKNLQDADNQVIVSSCNGESTDTFLADFAVGIKARFLKVGAPVRGERTAQLNRLLQIEGMLEMSSRLASQEKFKFPHITPPPLPEPEEGEEEPAKKEATPRKK